MNIKYFIPKITIVMPKLFKVCAKCKKRKFYKEFYFVKNKKYLAPRCRACEHERKVDKRDYYNELERKAYWRRKNKG